MNSFRNDFRSIAAVDPILRQPQCGELKTLIGAVETDRAFYS
jgi:hypothetical protein